MRRAFEKQRGETWAAALVIFSCEQVAAPILDPSADPSSFGEPGELAPRKTS